MRYTDKAIVALTVLNVALMTNLALLATKAIELNVLTVLTH